MMEHQSVMLHETIDLLNVRPDGIYIDGTLGRGGHSGLLASKLEHGHLYGIDQDDQALAESAERLKEYGDRITLIKGNFREMKALLEPYGIHEADGIMMDLGVSSPQFDDPARGFSYRFDSRLDMRMDQTQKLDAWTVVNTYSAKELSDILFRYGEERNAGRIANAIVKAREHGPVNTTFELNDIIRSALPDKILRKKGHPAKQTYQALRIEVNDELSSLKSGLQDAVDMLAPGGRLAVITFHSLEDRMVKSLFKELTSAPFVEPKIPVKASQMEQASFTAVTRKAVTASEEELNVNHRSHSAKLRVIERNKKG